MGRKAVSKVCVVCGRSFAGIGTNKICSQACADLWRTPGGRKIAKDKAMRQKRLNEAIAEAKKMGLSYGQYQARRYMELKGQ